MKPSRSVMHWLLIILLALLPVWMGCSDDENPESPPEDVPPLPPQSSMMLDFSAFQDGGNGSPTLTRQNWLAAVVVIGVWNTVLGAVFLPPAAVFGAAMNQTPTHPDANTWVWTFTTEVMVNGVQTTYTAELTGVVNLQSDQVAWSMVVDASGGMNFDNFEWFNGWSRVNASEGVWHIFDAATPNQQMPLYDVDWTHLADNDHQATFTWRKTGGGIPVASYISYGVEPEADPYDAYYVVHNAEANETANIQWNRTTGSGQFHGPNYNNGLPACWDENQNDVDCP